MSSVVDTERSVPRFKCKQQGNCCCKVVWKALVTGAVGSIIPVMGNTLSVHVANRLRAVKHKLLSSLAVTCKVLLSMQKATVKNREFKLDMLRPINFLSEAT